MTQLVMTGALRHVLIQHFSDTRNILNSTLRERLTRDGVWSDDASATGLQIESLHRWRPELTESRPGLILKEGAWTNERKGIGDLREEDQRTGTFTFSTFWQGTHTVFAIAREAAEAQILAIEALKCMQWFGPVIAKQLQLHRFVPISIGEVAVLQEATEHFVVPVVFGYVIEDSWSLQPEAARLKRIVFRTSEVLRDY